MTEVSKFFRQEDLLHKIILFTALNHLEKSVTHRPELVVLKNLLV
jgi:hypothetical protein